MLVVPTENLLIVYSTPGKKYPIETPKNIAKKIHTVRYLSMNPNRVVSQICLVTSLEISSFNKATNLIYKIFDLLFHY